MGWKLAPALAKLIAETNAKWPNRSKAFDGTIGDAAHQKRDSEHNPDENGIVLAADITLGGTNRAEFLDAVIGDPRVHYVINKDKIYSRSYNWAARPYKGANRHTGYAHVSLRNRVSESASAATVKAAANDTSSWFDAKSAPKEVEAKPVESAKPVSVLKKGSKGARVKALQQGLNRVFPAYRKAVAPKGMLLTVDGVYGDHTARWVMEFQRRVGLKPDAIVGDKTVASLARHGIKV